MATPRYHSLAPDIDPLQWFAIDMAEQARWLAQEAWVRGFSSLDDLVLRHPHTYFQLAARWRKTHPLLGFSPGATAGETTV